jgi:selenocysteine lyase/cysteine desulfurase/short-subunit dehydrogenase
MNDRNIFLPSLHNKIFFNYAATSPVFKLSIDIIQEHIDQFNEPLSSHFEQWFIKLEEARKCVASLISAHVSEICFVQGASVGLSIIANAINWEKDDEVLIPANEFPSNRIVWQALAKRGVTCKIMPFDANHSFSEQIQQVDLRKVKLIAFSLSSYLDGYIENAELIAKIAKENDCITLVDASQAVGIMPVNVTKLNCDLLVCGGQKWLFGPISSGFLFIKSTMLNNLLPSFSGWCSVENPFDFSDKPLILEESARRFEPSLQNIPYIQGLRKSIEVLQEIGWDSIYERTNFNRLAIQEIFQSIKPYSERSIDSHSGIITYQCSDNALCDKLKKQQIITTIRDGYLRLSTHYFTSEKELDVLSDCLSKKYKVSEKKLKIVPLEKRNKYNTALITGASSGLGLAIAKQLASQGVDLLLIARNEDKLKKIKNSLEQSYSIHVEYHSLDLSNSTILDSFLETSKLQHIRYIINNVAFAKAELFELSDEKIIEKMFHINCYAAFKIVKAILPNMIAEKDGYILNIVTSGARTSFPLFSIYSATKSALWSWSESLSRELKSKGISVTAYLPPHMISNLYYGLARNSLSYYQTARGASQKNHDPDDVARDAVNAMMSRQSIKISWATKLKIFLNLFFNNFMTKKISKAFIY